MSDLTGRDLVPPVKNPCPECQWTRTSKPGALGGSPITTYIGQIHGPFVLPCHMHCDFNDKTWREPDALSQTPQCAGAAIMRANIGVDVLMPASLIRLPAGHARVFASVREFVLHHGGVSPVEAAALTSPRVVTMLLQDQILRQKKGLPA